MNEQIKQQQQWLWDHGYAPKDKTEKQFVDGINGPMTQAALRLAKERNWEFVNGTPTYKAKWPSVPENTLIKQFNSNLNSAKKSAQSQVEARNKENKKYGSTMRGNQKKFTIELQRDLKNAGYKLGASGKNKDGVDGIWGKKSDKALNQAIKDGYKVVNNRLVKPEKTVSFKFTSPTSPSVIGLPLNYGFSSSKKEISDPSKVVKTGKAFYISYPEHKISTSGTGLEEIFGTHLPTPISGHAASIIVDDGGNATYHYYGRYGDKGSYHTKLLPKWKQGISEKDYVKSIRPHLEYTNNNEPVTAVYIPNVDANKARNYYKRQPNTGKYNLFNGTTCVGEACAGIDAGRGESSSTLFDYLIPDTPENVRRNYSRMSGTKTINF